MKGDARGRRREGRGTGGQGRGIPGVWVSAQAFSWSSFFGRTQLLQTSFRAGPNIPLGRYDSSREFCVNTESRVRCLGLGDNEHWNCAGCMTAAYMSRERLLCPTLCDPIDGSPPGSPVPGILQARTLEWVAISFSNAVKSESEVTQLCQTLRDPMDCSPPGSSAHGIFQARVLQM